MLPKGLTGGAVCLRCRLAGLRQPVRSTSAASRFQTPGQRRLIQSRTPLQSCSQAQAPKRTHLRSLSHPRRFLATTSDGAAPDSRPDEASAQAEHEADSAPQAPTGPTAIESSTSGEGRPANPDFVVKYSGIRGDAKEARRHKANNRILTESYEPLDGARMLGNPVFALTMRESAQPDRPRREPLPQDPNQAPDDELQKAHHAAIFQSAIDAQPGPASLDEAIANLHDLRPESDTYLLRKDFVKLRQTLAGGFLTAHLSHYLTTHDTDTHSTENAAASAYPTDGQYDWISDMGTWRPLDVDRAASPEQVALHGYLEASATNKDRLAVRIMRQCWGLAIDELRSTLGSIAIRVHDLPLGLLLPGGTQRFINHVRAHLLSPGEDIEVVFAQNTLRLLTTQAKVPVIVHMLDSHLKNATHESLSLDLITDGPVPHHLLDRLSSITNTTIQHSLQDPKELRLSWIETRDRDLGQVLEDRCHTAFRLLWTALAPSRASSSLHTESIPHGRFFPDLANADKWAWKDRMADWARYAQPLAALQQGKSSFDNFHDIISKTGGPLVELPQVPGAPKSSFVCKQTTEPDKAAEGITEDVIGGSLDQIHSATDGITVNWADAPETLVAAHFGHVLHGQAPTGKSLDIDYVMDRTVTHPRIFSPITPHPLQLAKLEKEVDDAAAHRVASPPSSTMVIRFWPSPVPISRTKRESPSRKSKKRAVSQNAQATAATGWPVAHQSKAPLLELHLTISDTKILGVEALRAITHSHVGDVLLPTSPVDVRFVQTIQTCLQSSAPDASQAEGAIARWGPIADFLAGSQLELDKGRLDMPPGQVFPVPRRLFSDYKADATESDESLHAMIDTAYDFVGLELRRAASIPKGPGDILTYTSIEAGQGGGSRAEVTLQPASSLANSGENQVQDQDGFVHRCLELAKENSLWTGAKI